MADDLCTSTLADTSSGRAVPSRRAVLTTAAWAVPAIALTAASPAFAASGARVSSVSTYDGQIPAAGGTAVTATVTDGTGTPVAGQTVSFTGPAGSSFSPSSATTDSSGLATSTLDLQDQWATPGSTATITAVTGGNSLSQGLTVLGANLLFTGGTVTSTPRQTELVFPSPVTQVAADGDGSFAAVLLKNGSVWTKGSNSHGQLGDGTTTDRSTWAPVPDLSDVTQMTIGNAQVLVLLSDGTVKQWGQTTTPSKTPVSVSGISGATQIAHGYGPIYGEASNEPPTGTSFALLSDGSLVAWGTNDRGSAGTGSTTPGKTPTRVVGLSSGVRSVYGGTHSSGAVMTDGTARTWGSNSKGALGYGGYMTYVDEPVHVAGVSTVKALAGNGFADSSGDNLFVLLTDGSVRGAGFSSDEGWLGNGQTTPSSNPTPVALPALASDVVQISQRHALKSDGSVVGWGWNAYGTIGDGTTTDRISPTPVIVPAGRTVIALQDNSGTPTASYFITAP